MIIKNIWSNFGITKKLFKLCNTLFKVNTQYNLIATTKPQLAAIPKLPRGYQRS